MKIFDIIMGRRKVRDAYTDGNGFVSRWARPPSRNTAEWLGKATLYEHSRVAGDVL